MTRKAVLFLCPIVPRETGNGLAMRAALRLQGLARRFDVHLLIIPVSGGGSDIPDFVRDLVVKAKIVDLAEVIDPLAWLIAQTGDPELFERRLAYPRPWAERFSGMAAARQALGFTEGVRLDIVHVMRLYLAPVAAHLSRLLGQSAPPLVVDLDDDDARVQLRLVPLYRYTNDRRGETLATAEAAKYTESLTKLLPHCHLALTSSDDDAERLRKEHPSARFATIPNGYAAALPARRRQARRDGALRLLFVANFSYLPNADGVRWLLGDVLPVLDTLHGDIQIDLVGAGLPPERGDDRVRVHGAIETLACHYAAADVAVVPLRAGGGTRIKILEAFAHRIPVVSTTVGAEGLAVRHGEHLLFADDPGHFAASCLSLAADPALAGRLVDTAAALLQRIYTPERIHAALDAAMDHLTAENTYHA